MIRRQFLKSAIGLFFPLVIPFKAIEAWARFRDTRPIWVPISTTPSFWFVHPNAWLEFQTIEIRAIADNIRDAAGVYDIDFSSLSAWEAYISELVPDGPQTGILIPNEIKKLSPSIPRLAPRAQFLNHKEIA